MTVPVVVVLSNLSDVGGNHFGVQLLVVDDDGIPVIVGTDLTCPDIAESEGYKITIKLTFLCAS